MPRLLILCEYPTLLGGERSMLSTLERVAAAGFDVRVAAPPTGALAATLRERQIPHIRWPVRRNQGSRRPLGELRQALAEIVTRERPDLLHANSLSIARVAGPVAKESGVRSLGHLRDIIALSRQAVGDLNCHRRLLAVSSATRDYHIAQGVDETKCLVVRNGVDLNRFRPRPRTFYLHADLRLPPTARLIATIGQISLRKAIDVTLDAARRVMPHNGDVHWLIVGERASEKAETVEYETRLRRMAAEPPLAGRVHFVGRRDDIAELMAECDVLVHTARQEPLGRVLIEAAASGVPVVATDVGGTREIFPPAADGAVLAAVDAPAEIAEAVISLLNDDARRRVLGRDGRRRAEAAFDVQLAAERLIEQYNEVLL
jgi:glycosyltransferase involved in cell wall biosynthesis